MGRPIWKTHAVFASSIGPLKNPFRPIIARELAKLDRVYVRDDRTKTELAPFLATYRCPDMALLEIGTTLKNLKDTKHQGPVYIVARDLPRSPAIRSDYIHRLQTLKALLPAAEHLVQSRGRGNDDVAFYTSIGWGPARDVQSAIAESGPGIMISVRLHGALQAILERCPTIHLTYERKGFGAYDDLGLRPYLHNATTFDPHHVAKQVSDLQSGAPYWSCIKAQQPCIQAAYSELKANVQRLAQ